MNCNYFMLMVLNSYTYTLVVYIYACIADIVEDYVFHAFPKII
jgi:hypothetical protein